MSGKWGQGPPAKPPGTEPPATCQWSEAGRHAPHLHTTRIQGKQLVPADLALILPSLLMSQLSTFPVHPAHSTGAGSPLCLYPLPWAPEMVLMGDPLQCTWCYSL